MPTPSRHAMPLPSSPPSPHARFPRPLHLPVPNADEVERFRGLYLAEYGVPISHAQALDMATRLIRYVFLTQYALPYLREQDQGKKDC